MSLIKLQNYWEQIPKSWLRDPNLGFKELGILCKLQSLPPEWEFSAQGLAAIMKDGIDSIRSGLQALEKLGYLTRQGQKRDNDGHYSGGDWVLHEAPLNKENPMSENPTSANPTQIKKERIKELKELNNKEKISKKERSDIPKKFKVPSIEELVAFKKEAGLDSVDVEYFFNYYESNGWKVGNHSMKNWKAAMRNWHTRNLKDRPQGAAGRAIVQADADSAPYVPEPTEDIREWRDFFDEWENIIGMRPAQTVGNVKAALLLKRELSGEMNQALMVALAMRSKTGYITKEIKEISSPRDLYRSKEKVWAFYQEHREQWQWQMNMRRSAGLD